MRSFIVIFFIVFLGIVSCAGPAKKDTQIDNNTTDIEDSTPPVEEDEPDLFVETGELEEPENVPEIPEDQKDENGNNPPSQNEDMDTDSDTILDRFDNCPEIANPDQSDTDNDGFGNLCDTDIDNDGIINENDNCIILPNPNQADIDENEIGDLCDPELDSDRDSIIDNLDNCPEIANSNQSDIDNDQIGDLCDTDLDEDGILNEDDNCPYIANSDQEGSANSERGNICNGEIEGVVETIVKFPLAGGNATGDPFQAKVVSPVGVTIIKDDGNKYLYLTDYQGHQLKRSLIKEDGTLQNLELIKDINYYPTGLISMSNGLGVFVLEYYVKQYLAGGTSQIFSTIEFLDQKTGNLKQVKDRSENDIKYNIKTEGKFSNSINGTISSDNRFLYYPLEGIGGHSNISCIEIDPITGNVLSNPTVVLESPLNRPYGTTIIGNKLYITDYKKHRILMVNVNGCTLSEDNAVTTIYDGIKNKHYYPQGITADTQKNILYFTISEKNDSSILALTLDEQGLPIGQASLIAGNTEHDGWQGGNAVDSGLNKPKGLAIDTETKRLYVADSANSTVKMIELSENGMQGLKVENLVGLVKLNKQEEKIMKENNLEASFRYGYGLAASGSENKIINIYASGFNSHTINYLRYDKNSGSILSGGLLAGTPYVEGNSTEGLGKFNAPKGLALIESKETNSSYLLVADMQNDAIKCVSINSAGNFMGITELIKGGEKGIFRPRYIAISKDARFAYISNMYTYPNSSGRVTFIQLDQKNACKPIEQTALTLAETDTQKVSPSGIKYFINENNNKQFLYFTTYKNNNNNVKRIEIDPNTGQTKADAHAEIILGNGLYGNVSGTNPLTTKLRYPSDLAFSTDNNHMYVTDASNRVVIDTLLDENGIAKKIEHVVGSVNSPYDSIDGIGTNASFVSPYALITLPVGQDGMSLWVFEEFSNMIRVIY